MPISNANFWHGRAVIFIRKLAFKISENISTPKCKIKDLGPSNN